MQEKERGELGERQRGAIRSDLKYCAEVAYGFIDCC